jgi:hypothetical protein
MGISCPLVIAHPVGAKLQANILISATKGADIGFHSP